MVECPQVEYPAVAVLRFFSPGFGKDGDQNQRQMGSAFREPIHNYARRDFGRILYSLDLNSYIRYICYISNHYDIVNRPEALNVIVNVSVSARVMLEP